MIEIRGGILSRRWAPHIILKLAPGAQKFNAMLNGIPGISDRILTERLRELEEVGLVQRVVDPGRPVRVVYELTRAAYPYVKPLAELAIIESHFEQEAAVG